jgi:hypothetical protein
MKLKIDTTEKTIQIEEEVDLDELMKEYSGKGFKIIPNFIYTYPIYPVYPNYPTMPEPPYYFCPTTSITK